MIGFAFRVFVGGVLEIATFIATVNAFLSAETRLISIMFVVVALVCAIVIDSDRKDKK